jgi:hypothetical protein
MHRELEPVSRADGLTSRDHAALLRNLGAVFLDSEVMSRDGETPQGSVKVEQPERHRRPGLKPGATNGCPSGAEGALPQTLCPKESHS